MSIALRLDCESRESAEASVALAFRCNPTDLREFLSDPGHPAYYEEQHQTILVDFDRFMFERACSAFGAPLLPQQVCWFHCTRVPAGTTFEEGILPLGTIVPSLEERIAALLADSRAAAAVRRAFARQGGTSFHFRNKLRNRIHWGPYAILVRESAEHGDRLRQHDYLRIPEIVEDLCEEVLADCGLDLLPTILSHWRPAVVKFVAPADESVDHALTAALRYLQAVALDGQPDGGSIWCFDGANTPVSRSQILRVEFP